MIDSTSRVWIEGHLVAVHYTTTDRSVDCADCRTGVCVQRVERWSDVPGYDTDLITHACQDELS